MKRFALVLSIIILAPGLNFLTKSETGWTKIADNDLEQLNKPLPNTPGCVDGACHKNIIEQEVIHPAAEDACENCHTSTGEEHPKKNVKGFTLSEQVPQLCYACHEDNTTKKNIHPPAEDGECLICHNPHSAKGSFLLNSYPASALCENCHDLSMTKNKVVHKPVSEGKCNKCHDPHQSDQNKFLKNSSPELCFKCHGAIEKQAELKNVHYPFEDACSNCHLPHSGELSRLLVEKVPDLCFGCHDDMKGKLKKANFVHGAINTEISCAGCHSPHASNNGKLLLAEGKDLCLSCHDKTINGVSGKIMNIGKLLKAGNSVHGAIEMNGCTGCHNPHAGNNKSLLVDVFPEGQYAEAKAENFALCFNCHDSELFTAGVTTTATNFRDRDKNLHSTHINGNKGRSCALCHNIHGSVNEHLINEKATFGSWEMQLNYASLENGGSCAPGCHAEKSYSR